MNSISRLAATGLMLMPALAYSQQSPNPQPPQAQVQSAPCVTTPTPNPSGNNATVKVPSKWKQYLDRQRQQIEAKTGIPVPDVATGIEQVANSKPAPCPPQASPPKIPQAAPAPALKLPPDTTVTLHCSPLTPSSKDANGHPTTLTLPDPHDFAVPKANEFEFDSVVPDLAAKTPCYLVKVDPKSNRSFVSQ